MSQRPNIYSKNGRFIASHYKFTIEFHKGRIQFVYPENHDVFKLTESETDELYNQMKTFKENN